MREIREVGKSREAGNFFNAVTGIFQKKLCFFETHGNDEFLDRALRIVLKYTVEGCAVNADMGSNRFNRKIVQMCVLSNKGNGVIIIS